MFDVNCNNSFIQLDLLNLLIKQILDTEILFYFYNSYIPIKAWSGK